MIPPIPYRHALDALQPYPPGKPIEEVQREFGLASVVKLASNENPYGPSPKALEAIANESKELHLYPEASCHYLRQSLAQRLEVAPDQLFFGNGSDEIVALLTAAYLEPEHNIVCSQGTFIRYEMGAAAMGAAVKKVPMKNWHHDTQGLAEAVDDKTRFVFLANPDNPVGTGVSSTDVLALLEALPPTTFLVLDEAYYEYARDWSDYPNAIQWLNKYPNLIICRTFSKAYGLAGLRIGYAIAPPETWDGVERIRPPFNVNRLAQVAAAAALTDDDHLQKTISGNAAGRARVFDALTELELDPVPSLANFILFGLNRPAMPVYDALLRRGVIIRPMGIYQLPQHLRVSIGLPNENEIFVEELSRCLKDAS